MVRNGFVYSVWSGRFTVKYGSIRQTDQFSELCYMKTRDEKSLLVSAVPGEVYNSIVWLEERDDAKACDILIAHEQIKIQRLLGKVENHFHKIDVFKDARRAGGENYEE